MNYGYAGTRELNEALVSRFVVVDMPVIGQDDLCKLLLRGFPSLKKSWARAAGGVVRRSARRSAAAGRSPPGRWICGDC